MNNRGEKGLLHIEGLLGRRGELRRRRYALLHCVLLRGRLCGALRRIRRARRMPEGRDVRKTLRGESGTDPLCQRGARDKPHDILDVPEIAVVRDTTLLIEGEPGYYVQLEMEWGRDGQRRSRDG